MPVDDETLAALPGLLEAAGVLRHEVACSTGHWLSNGQSEYIVRQVVSPLAPDLAREVLALRERLALAEALAEAVPPLLRLIEGINGAMQHGTWRDDHGHRLKDTPEWVAFYVAARHALREARRPAGEEGA